MNSSTSPAPSRLGEKQEESIICSPPVDLLEEIVPLAPARRLGCPGPGSAAHEGTQKVLRSPRGKPGGASGLQRELQRCPASQRNKCLHYLLVNNLTCLGFVFKLARATRFSKSLATTSIMMLFGGFKICSPYFYISIPTDCVKGSDH